MLMWSRILYTTYLRPIKVISQDKFNNWPDVYLAALSSTCPDHYRPPLIFLGIINYAYNPDEKFLLLNHNLKAPTICI